jgi:hypothetical protein
MSFPPLSASPSWRVLNFLSRRPTAKSLLWLPPVTPPTNALARKHGDLKILASAHMSLASSAALVVTQVSTKPRGGHAEIQ